MTYEIVNERTGEVIAAKAALLAGPLARMKGLLGRSGLDQDEAVILRPCASLHTAFMRFNLDVVFLDKQGRVLKVARDLRPFRMTSKWGAHDAIEMAAGALTSQLSLGDRLLIRPNAV